MNKDHQPKKTEQSARTGKKTGKGRRIGRTVGIVLGTILLVIVLTSSIFVGIFMTYVNTSLKGHVEVDMSEYDQKVSTELYYQDPETKQTELRYPTLLSARDERHVQTVLEYRNEVREWSIERLMEAEKNFFTKCGRLPEPYEYTAENGLPMYSVFCRLAKEAFEEIIRAQFLETQELSGPVLTM